MHFFPSTDKMDIWLRIPYFEMKITINYIRAVDKGQFWNNGKVYYNIANRDLSHRLIKLHTNSNPNM